MSLSDAGTPKLDSTAALYETNTIVAIRVRIKMLNILYCIV